jgi:hypothetical protein
MNWLSVITLAFLWNISVVFSASASTVEFRWIGNSQFLSGDVLGYPNYAGYPLVMGSYSASFVFDVDHISKDSFSYEGYFLNDIDAASSNPDNAVLISRPAGHLGGYFGGYYNLSFSKGKLSVNATLSDYDDFLFLSSNSIGDDHNQGYIYYGSSGYWLALVDNNMIANSQISTVPLPASAFLLLFSVLPLLALSRRKHTRQFHL